MSTSRANLTIEPQPAADRLRQEMRTIRRELGNDVEVLVGHAERLMDWRYYLQRFPWACVGAATLIGYFIVPQRIVTLPTDEHTLSRLAERLPIRTKPPEPKKQTLLSWLISMGAGMALKAATGYLSQQFNKVVAQQSAPQHSEVHHG